MDGLNTSEDEIYVTCVCGALVNEKDMLQHIEGCLKDEFIKNATSLKISKPNSRVQSGVKARHVCAKCVRCANPMYKDEGTLITLYPSMPDSVVMCCNYKMKTGRKQVLNESICKMCKLPNGFHEGNLVNKIRTVNCIDSIDTSANNTSENVGIEKKCRQKQAMISEFLQTFPDVSSNSVDAPEHEHLVLCDEIPKQPACKLFHVSLLPNYNNDDEDSSYPSYSMLLQILDSFPPATSVATQTDLPNTAEFGIQVKILGVYPEEVEKLLATGKDGYDIPNFDPAAIAAYKSHLSTLIPCKHCSRTFSPDRIQKHMSCCIERPRSSIRECRTPKGGEIPR